MDKVQDEQGMKKRIIKLCAGLLLLILLGVGVLAWFVYYGPDNTSVTKNKMHIIIGKQK